MAEKMMYVCVALIGLYLIVQSQGTGDSKQFIGIVYGLIAACFYTALTFTNKCIGNIKEPGNTLIQLSLAAFFPLFLYTWDNRISGHDNQF
ncbi:hypothetical protein OL548_13240 [Lysinibacillus sp. MHQ-1]|nr:hypothetical protein OL548_13240 [Lysinibacillus sp. MHQ-1]